MVANGLYLVVVFRIQTKFFKIVFMERFFDDKCIASSGRLPLLSSEIKGMAKISA